METMKPLIDTLEKNLEKINVAHKQLSNEASYLSPSRKFIEDLIHVILNNGNQIYIPRGPVFELDNNRYSVKSQKFDSRENLISFFESNITSSFIGIYQLYEYRIISFETFEPKEAIIMRYATDWVDKDKRFSDLYKQKEQKVDFITIEEMTI